MNTLRTMNDIIFQSTSPWNNPYQGKDPKVLFACSAGILRSATMQRMYSSIFNTRSCGTHHYALIPMSNDLLAWADAIVFVNAENYLVANTTWDFGTIKAEGKRVVVLDIPDQYEHMAPELQQEIRKQFDQIAVEIQTEFARNY